MSVSNLEGKKILFTGAAGGLGQPAVNEITEQGAHVIATGRSKEKVAAVFAENELVSPVQLDLGNPNSIKHLSEDLSQLNRLDRLVLNASIWANAGDKTVAGNDETFGVNYLGNFELLGRTLELLKSTPESRVVIVSSLLYVLGSINLSDLNYKHRSSRWEMQRYADSKLALIYLANYLNNVVFTGKHSDHQAVIAIPVQGSSGIFDNSQGKGAQFLGKIMKDANPSSKEGAQPIVEAVTQPMLEKGSVIIQPAIIKPASILMRGRDEKVMARLIEKSEEMTGVALK